MLSLFIDFFFGAMKILHGADDSILSERRFSENFYDHLFALVEFSSIGFKPDLFI